LDEADHGEEVIELSILVAAEEAPVLYPRGRNAFD
jgi:hypothetical protein